jgi:hypothetical protein
VIWKEEAERYLGVRKEWAILAWNDMFSCAMGSSRCLRANRLNGHRTPTLPG